MEGEHILTTTIHDICNKKIANETARHNAIEFEKSIYHRLIQDTCGGINGLVGSDLMESGEVTLPAVSGVGLAQVVESYVEGVLSEKKNQILIEFQQVREEAAGTSSECGMEWSGLPCDQSLFKLKQCLFPNGNRLDWYTDILNTIVSKD